MRVTPEMLAFFAVLLFCVIMIIGGVVVFVRRLDKLREQKRLRKIEQERELRRAERLTRRSAFKYYGGKADD